MVFIYSLINVSKSYENYRVLNNVTLSLPRTGFISILGKSGSGKSTLLNLLIGLDKPTKGEVLYLNKNISKFKNNELKHYQNNEIGMLFQHFNMFDELTSIENVIIPSLLSGINEKESNEKARELFKKYALEELMNQKFKTLSGGEKQRVALLRAIINKPKVILADEPTGALDSKNSVLILNELKQLSKECLVIVVTHNEELIKLYEDIRLTLNKGTIFYQCQNKINESMNIKNNKSNLNVIKKFIKLHLRKHLVRNIIASLAISFASLCSILSLGYINGSSTSINNYKKESLLYNYATIAKKTIIDVPNSPIKISKLTRPDENEINFIKEEIKPIHFENNYEIIFPSNPTFIFDHKTRDDIAFNSVYDFSIFNNLLIKGKMPEISLNEVVVNEEFVKYFSYNNDNIINTTLTLSFTSTINNKNYYGQNIKDIITFSQQLKIVGIVKEFAYLNSPRIYYSYLGLDNYFNETILNNYSKEIGFNISIKEMVSFVSGDDANSSYSYIVFIDDINEVDKLFKLKEKFDKNNEYDIESNSYTITSSYISMNDVITTSLIVFITLIALASIFILIITAYSNFTQNKKTSAILSILGTKRALIFNIFNIENNIVSLIGLFFSFILLIPFKALANYFIYKLFNLTNLISINLFSPLFLLLTLIVAFIASASTFIPFMFYEKGYILEELKDE